MNVLDCRSVYRWEGTVHDDEEVLLLAKTTEERYGALVERVLAEHPSDVPCIERFEETPIPAFADWREEAVEEGVPGE